MFSYTVAKETDNEAFVSVCALIESSFPTIEKEELLIDVDGSTIQIYHFNNETIKVFDDYYVDATYVDSEIDLNHLITSLV